ncbi:MAG: 30S ribosomal protein S20 [Clostridia bacterium]
MPNIKSAKKRVLINETKTAQNKVVKKAYKEAVKAFDEAVVNKEANVADLHKVAVSAVDKAWSKGVLAKNTAARKVANLTKKLAK